MKTDILNRNDIEALVNVFYDKVKKCEPLCFHFTAVNWEKHLPVMYDFWENVIFSTGIYEGNPMAIHKRIHQQQPLSPMDFRQWIDLFTETVHILFEGENADLIRQRAESIASIMQVKIFHTIPGGGHSVSMDV